MVSFNSAAGSSVVGVVMIFQIDYRLPKTIDWGMRKPCNSGCIVYAFS